MSQKPIEAGINCRSVRGAAPRPWCTSSASAQHWAPGGWGGVTIADDANQYCGTICSLGAAKVAKCLSPILIGGSASRRSSMSCRSRACTRRSLGKRLAEDSTLKVRRYICRTGQADPQAKANGHLALNQDSKAPAGAAALVRRPAATRNIRRAGILELFANEG